MSKTSSEVGSIINDVVVRRFDDEDSWEEEELYEKIQRNNNGNGERLDTITEIDDEGDSSITSTTTVNNVNGDGDTTKTTSSKDVVCVCVDKNHRESSMDALSWTLQHWITPSSSLCLLYVFPFIRLIPSPIGYMERVVVDSMYVDYHIEQIKDKKKLLLRKFIDLCTSSQVEVEPIPVECDESNNVVKAILKHVQTHGITKLVIGITKANLRRRSSVVNEILKKAPENCVVRIICEGNDVTFEIITSSDSPLDNGCNSNSYSIPRSTSSREHNYYRGLGFFMRYFGIPFTRKQTL